MDQDEMNELDWRKRPGGDATPEDLNIESDYFPFRLDPPIVLVGRNDSYDEEREIEALVSRFGGVFAGT